METVQINNENRGIDIGIISTCKLIRLYANVDNIKLVISDNSHLHKITTAYDSTPRQLIKGYLSVIQPYNLRLKQDKISETYLGYNIILTIEVADSGLVVTVHDNYSECTVKHNELCPVFANRLISCIRGMNVYTVEVTLQRGMIRENAELIASDYHENGLAFVEYGKIQNFWLDKLKEKANYLADYYYSIDTDNFAPLNSIKTNKSDISFVSYGLHNVSGVCMFIELYNLNYENKTIVRYIVDAVENILFNTSVFVLDEIKNTVSIKYSSDNKLVNMILDFKGGVFDV